MLKKLAFIGILTGVGQIFSVFVLKYLAQKSEPFQIALLGQADALSQFTVNVIAFGLQSAAMRIIATQEDWRMDYCQTQKARFTLSLIVLLFSFTALFEPEFIVLAVAPFFALNGDYALYASGHPSVGAIIALLRIFVPFGAVAIAAYTDVEQLVYVFIISLIFIYGLTNWIISKYLRVPLLVKPSLSSLKLYFKALPLGFVTIALYFIGFGLLMIAPYLFDHSENTAVLVAGLKVYMLYKGLLRIVHQVYMREIMKEDMRLIIDKTGIIAGTAFLVFFLLYTDSVVTLLFGSNYTRYAGIFQALGISAWVYSFFSSVTTLALLKKQDKAYAVISGAAALVTIILFSLVATITDSPFFSVLAILAGELIFAIFMIIQLQLLKEVKPRIFFATEIFFYAIGSCGLRLFTGDSFVALGFSIIFYAGIIILTQQKLLKQMLKD